MISILTLKMDRDGYTVTVYEASGRVGGRMTTDILNDCLIDRGAQFLSADYSTLMPLIHELGMQSELVEASEWAGIVRGKKIRKISGNSSFSPIISGYLSLKEAFQFLLKIMPWRSRILGLPLDDYAAWQDFDDEYADKFIRREFSETILEYLIEPQTQEFHYQFPEEISKVHALMLLSFMIKKGKILNLRYGMGSLPEKIAKLLNIKLNCPISSLNISSSGNVELVSNVGKFYADRVVLATPATFGKTIFKFANEIESQLLQGQYNATINIAIATNADWELPKYLRNAYGILVPRRERQSVAAIAIESNKSIGRVNEGELFDIMLDSSHGAKYFNMSDSEILAAIQSELENYLPGVMDSIRLTHITRWQDAEPISYLGKSKYISEYKKTLSSSSRVILAGDYMGFPYTDSASYTGKWAANFIKDSNI